MMFTTVYRTLFSLWVPVSSTGKVSCRRARDLGSNPACTKNQLVSWPDGKSNHHERTPQVQIYVCVSLDQNFYHISKKKKTNFNIKIINEKTKIPLKLFLYYFKGKIQVQFLRSSTLGSQLNSILNLNILGKDNIVCISLVNATMCLNLIGELNVPNLRNYT